MSRRIGRNADPVGSGKIPALPHPGASVHRATQDISGGLQERRKYGGFRVGLEDGGFRRTVLASDFQRQ